MNDKYAYRAAQPPDFEMIAAFPQNEEELFYMYPHATFPLTPAQLESSAKERLKPTVVTCGNEVAAYGNFYGYADTEVWIGNVIVSPAFREKGAAAFLIETMEQIAREQLNVATIKIACHNTNTRGLLLYAKLGYAPYRLTKVKKASGEIAALIRMKKEMGVE